MEKVIILEEKKFMWDNRTYMSESEALKIKAEYEKNKFETHLVHEEEKYYLFTKRVVTEIKIDTQ